MVVPEKPRTVSIHEIQIHQYLPVLLVTNEPFTPWSTLTNYFQSCITDFGELLMICFFVIFSLLFKKNYLIGYVFSLRRMKAFHI
jgi:hypothetical protein